jgi:predicted nucleic acid-binding protein
MEQPKYLIDTNVVIDYLGKKLPLNGMQFMNTVIDDIPNVSVVTKIEVLGFNTPDQHYQILTSFMNDATVLELNDTIVNATIELRKQRKTKLPDAIIAATAIAYGFTLITNNTKDFKNIDTLTLIDPHSIT